MNRNADLKIDCLVHDLNNVFQTIIEAADLVGSDPAWESVAAIILRSVEQGRAIVSSIAQNDELPVPIDEQVAQAVKFSQDCMALMHGPALEFERELAPGIRLPIHPAALERVLVNLFINSGQAARAAGRDSCRIHIKAHERADGVEIEIADDGPGIAEETLPVMFLPGYSTDHKRSGLGLHIVQSLVAEAGGEVKAFNGRTGGARFEIHLPAVRPVATGAV